MPYMYDAVDLSNIPSNAAYIAAYIDGHFANYNAAKAMFPNAVVIPITVFASDNEGTILDCETGDATPAQCPTWVNWRRSKGIKPIVYCNVNTWPSVIYQFQIQGVALPGFWIAQYDGDPTIPSGAIAKQFQSTTYDLSNISQTFVDLINNFSTDWLGALMSTPDGEALIWRVHAILNNLATVAGGPTVGEKNLLHDALMSTYDSQALIWRVHALLNNLANVAGGSTVGEKNVLHDVLGQLNALLTSDETTLLNAIKTAGTGVVTEAQVSEIEAALVKALPGYTVQINPNPVA